MYAIYCDGECFFNDLTNLQETALISPELDLKDNTAGTLTFTLPKTNVVYDHLTRLASKIVVKRDGVEIWEGRALTEQKDFVGQRKITCEGELGYLNDTIQPQETYENPTVLTFFNAVINKHNEKVSADKQFTVGSVTVDDEMIDETGEEDPDFPIVYTDFTSTLETINEKLINNFGGHIRIRKVNGVRYIDYLKDYVDTSTQKIEFSNNLMDFVIDYDETEFCTVLIPLGEKFDITAEEGYEEYLDICDVNDGKNYLVNEEAKGIFGWIEKIAHFDEIDDESELLAKGQEYLSDTQFGSMKLNVNALDLNLLDRNVEEFKMLYEVEVISVFHGLDKMFPITEIKIPLDNPANTSYTLGDVESKNLSGMTSTISKQAVEAASKAFPKSSILAEAQASAQGLIDSATNGFVTITKGGNGKTASLIISNTDNPDTATKKWVWNINGLGYMQNGQILSAMTMDGQIVADRITTGSLNADRISGGTLNADNITVQTGGNSGSKLVFKNGRIIGYYGGTEKGYIEMKHYNDLNVSGIHLHSDRICIDAPTLSVWNGSTGYVDGQSPGWISFVKGISTTNLSSVTAELYKDRVRLRFSGGILVEWWQYDENNNQIDHGSNSSGISGQFLYVRDVRRQYYTNVAVVNSYDTGGIYVRQGIVTGTSNI